MFSHKIKIKVFSFITFLLLTLTLISIYPIQAAAPVNDTASTNANTPITIDVLANDVDDNTDAVIASAGRPNEVCFGDGAGGFSCRNMNSDRNTWIDVSLGDVNNDTFLDAIFANRQQRNRVCTSNGRGAFT
jgi:hypothetical protein